MSDRPAPPSSVPRPFTPRVDVLSVLVGCAVLSYTAAATGSLSLSIAVLGIAAMFALGLLRPALFLMLVILIRPLLDEFTRDSFGVQSANPAGGLGLIVICVAVGLLATRRRAVSPPFAVAFGLVILVSLGGAAIAMMDFGATIGTSPISEVSRLVAICAMGFLAANFLTSPDRLRQLFVVVGLSGVAPAVLGVSQLFTGAGVAEGLDVARISGPFVGPNPLGMYCAFTALLLIFLPREWLAGWVRIVALVPILVALVATYSRAGWFMFLAGLLLMGWRRQKRLVLGAILSVAVVIALVPAVQNRVLPSNETGSDSGGTYESYDWRIQNWRGLLAKATEQPMVGHGTKTTIYVNQRRTVDRQNRADGGFEAHNAVVRILVEGGIVLLAAYVVFVAYLVRTLRRLTRIRWSFQPLAKIVTALWLVFLLVGIGTDDSFDATVVLYGLFAMTAALEGALRHEDPVQHLEAPKPEPTSVPLNYAHPVTSS